MNLSSNFCQQCENIPGRVKVRNQVNEQTAYIDMATVYGNTAGDNLALREFVGGRMITSKSAVGTDLLPRRYCTFLKVDIT